MAVNLRYLHTPEIISKTIWPFSGVNDAYSDSNAKHHRVMKPANTFLLSGHLTLFCLLSALPDKVQAQFAYTIANREVTITSYTGPGGVVGIPATIEGFPVTGLGASAFVNNDQVTGVAVGNWVTRISDGAFDGCRKLTAITVSAGNPYYSSQDGVLFDRARLALLRFPPGRSGAYAIPATVSTVGPGAFAGCDYLTSVAMGNSVAGLGSRTFATCAGLKEITVGSGNPYYSSLEGVLFDRSRLALMRYPPGRVGTYSIPATVSTIEPEAFDGCAGLTEVVIGNAVVNLSAATFSNCGALTQIIVGAGNPYFSSVDGVLFDRSRTALVRLPEGRTGSYTIPRGVSAIGPESFANCAGLTGINLGYWVTTIGDRAFVNCAALTGIYGQGNAPVHGVDIFDGSSRAIVFYLPGTSGWGETYGGRPTVLWNPRLPAINTGIAVRAGQFGIELPGAGELTVVIEAANDLANPEWTVLGTCKLTGGVGSFSDPDWAKLPHRFYRLRSL